MNKRKHGEACACEQRHRGEKRPPAAQLIGEPAGGGLEQQGSQTRRGGSESNGVISPIRLFEKDVEDRKNHAHHFGLKEVGGVQAGQTTRGEMRLVWLHRFSERAVEVVEEPRLLEVLRVSVPGQQSALRSEQSSGR